MKIIKGIRTIVAPREIKNRVKDKFKSFISASD